jgi:uncharacterized membrane protein YphA (DoxX/SURF4 family)
VSSPTRCCETSSPARPRVARALPWIGLVVRLLAAAIWLVSGAAKVADLTHFQAQVHAYDLLPGALEAPFAYALPFVEIAIGAYLLVGLLVRPVAIFACLLMVVFIAAMAQAWARGLSLDCGCFGSLAREPVGLGTILRDAALGIPSLILAIWPARLLSLDSAWLGRPDEFGGRWRAERATARR